MSGQVTTNATVLQSLAERLEHPPAKFAIVRASHHVLDWLGCAAAGRATPVGRRFAAVAPLAEGGSITRIGGPRTSLSHALQVNAALGGLLEMDDLHRSSILHPGPVIVPATVAVAEYVAASGAALLAAIVPDVVRSLLSIKAHVGGRLRDRYPKPVGDIAPIELAIPKETKLNKFKTLFDAPPQLAIYLFQLRPHMRIVS